MYFLELNDMICMNVISNKLASVHLHLFSAIAWLLFTILSSQFLFLAEPLAFPSGGGKSFIMGSDDVLESVLGLGDLADLTVTNDADYSYDVSTHWMWNYG